MPDIQTLKSTYFVQSDDADPPTKPEPTTYENSDLVPLIDGDEYFSDLAGELAALGDGPDSDQHFLYSTGWQFDLKGLVELAPGSAGMSGKPGMRTGPFKLTASADPLLDLLKTKARAGVDVRLLGNVFWALMGTPGGWLGRQLFPNQAGAWTRVSASTLHSIADLREESKLSNDCCLNTLSHTVGSAHAKLVVLRNKNGFVAYTGGIDFEGSRHAARDHTQSAWHDIQVKITGPAVQSIYDVFRALWNEQVDRDSMTFSVGDNRVPSVPSGAEDVPGKSLGASNAGTHHVQSHITIPQFNYETVSFAPEGESLSFAPAGRFEVANAWQTAIEGAEEYVYIENYEFGSPTVMSWLNGRLKAESDLKVILLSGTRPPSEPALSVWSKRAIKQELLDGLNQAQKDRIAIFGREDAYVHSKTLLIDDSWVCIGSPNCSPRSLYTDIEHCVTALDEAGTLVPAYRAELWGEHLGVSESQRQAGFPLEQALHAFDNNWGSSGLGVSSPPLKRFSVSSIDSASTGVTDFQEYKHRTLDKPDSRENWGVFPG